MTKYVVTQRPHYIGGKMVHPNRGEASVVDIDDKNPDESLRVAAGQLLVPYSKAAAVGGKPSQALPPRTKGKIVTPKSA